MGRGGGGGLYPVVAAVVGFRLGIPDLGISQAWTFKDWRRFVEVRSFGGFFLLWVEMDGMDGLV